MDNRLLNIAKCIGEKGFADVGTDHGYLPIYMAKNGYRGNIVASDINQDPLNCAIRNAEEAGVSDKMEFILCNGLDGGLRDKIDSIVIAGMGGDSICGILDRADWCMDKRYKLILQPMTKAEILRYWLCCNDFQITDEILIDDNGTVYQLICARYGKREMLSDAELFLGKLELVRDNPLFEKCLDKNLRRFEKLIKGLRVSRDSKEIASLPLYQQIYGQLCSIRDMI